ncbi:MAG TPA: hypothetical protein VFY62_19430 [Pseudomonas sp.]|nr:hypothetical protein [Pseudomonas sp.]
MKAIAEMSLQELAAFVCSHLKQHDIPVVLVGGSCVSIYSDNRYQTADLDFVERYHTKRAALRKALAEIGFKEENRYFVHPDTAWFLEFPTGPLAVGDGPVEELNEVATDTGLLTLLTPTDCIKDRLAAYFHWRDRQALQQAVWVAQRHAFDRDAVRAWSAQEGMAEKFEEFVAALEG